MENKDRFQTIGDVHFQSDLFNGSEEDGEPDPTRRYEPHALEMHTPEPKIISEKTIFLDPSIIFNGIEKKSLWYRIMHKKFHIGWVFLVLGIGLVASVTLLIKVAT